MGFVAVAMTFKCPDDFDITIEEHDARRIENLDDFNDCCEVKIISRGKYDSLRETFGGTTFGAVPNDLHVKLGD